MGIRNGQQYVQDLQRNHRDVYINGEKVTDVTTHAFFASSIRAIAALYDAQFNPKTQEVLTYIEPETGERAGMAFMAPRSAEDLRKKREAYLTWARMSFGLLGRSPDFLASILYAFSVSKGVFDKDHQKFQDNVVRYFKFVRDNDLFLTHALVTPQNDRSKNSAEQASAGMHLRVTKETDMGIYVSGARMLATLAPIADEVLSYNLPGLKPGEEDYALAFAIPDQRKGAASNMPSTVSHVQGQNLTI